MAAAFRHTFIHATAAMLKYFSNPPSCLEMFSKKQPPTLDTLQLFGLGWRLVRPRLTFFEHSRQSSSFRHRLGHRHQHGSQDLSVANDLLSWQSIRPCKCSNCIVRRSSSVVRRLSSVVCRSTVTGKSPTSFGGSVQVTVWTNWSWRRIGGPGGPSFCMYGYVVDLKKLSKIKSGDVPMF